MVAMVHVLAGPTRFLGALKIADDIFRMLPCQFYPGKHNTNCFVLSVYVQEGHHKHDLVGLTFVVVVVQRLVAECRKFHFPTRWHFQKNFLLVLLVNFETDYFYPLCICIEQTKQARNLGSNPCGDRGPLSSRLYAMQGFRLKM